MKTDGATGKRSLSVKTKIMLVVTVTSLLGLLLAGAALVSYDRYSATESLVQEVEVLGRVIAYSSDAALVFDDPGQARENLTALSASTPIQAACLYDGRGALFASYVRGAEARYPCPAVPPAPGHRIQDDRLEVVQAIRLDGNVVGALYLVSSLQSVQQRLLRYLTVMAIVVPLALLAASLASIRLQRRITGPLLSLAGIAKRIARHRDYSLRAQRLSADEVGVLVDAFNEMLDEIAASEQERKRHVQELQFQASHDSLTGLPNRYLLFMKLSEALSQAEASGCTVMLALLDLDRFKEVNDTLGHHFGDLLLRRISEVLSDAVPAGGATVARLGGDEFAILFPSVGTVERGLQQLRDILARLRSPFVIENVTVEVGASAGVSVFPVHGTDQATLMRRADIAMYKAKEESWGYALYSPEYDQFSPRRLELITDLASAIRENQLYLVYQPKVDLHDGRVAGFEALARWNHPRHGVVPPGQFVPLAELGDTIRALTYSVMDQAFRQARLWNGNGQRARVAVNLSSRNLTDRSCVPAIVELMQKHQVDPQWLEFEITETAIMTEVPRARETLERISGIGIRLSVDDFGTGYSSLVHLRELPVSALKVDLSFVANMVDSPQDCIIVKSIVDMAHNLGLEVIAEGVENAATLEALRSIGCDQAQGFHITAPLRGDDASQWAASNGEQVLRRAEFSTLE